MDKAETAGFHGDQLPVYRQLVEANYCGGKYANGDRYDQEAWRNVGDDTRHLYEGDMVVEHHLGHKEKLIQKQQRYEKQEADAK